MNKQKIRYIIWELIVFNGMFQWDIYIFVVFIEGFEPNVVVVGGKGE